MVFDVVVVIVVFEIVFVEIVVVEFVVMEIVVVEIVVVAEIVVVDIIVTIVDVADIAVVVGVIVVEDRFLSPVNYCDCSTLTVTFIDFHIHFKVLSGTKKRYNENSFFYLLKQNSLIHV